MGLDRSGHRLIAYDSAANGGDGAILMTSSEEDPSMAAGPEPNPSGRRRPSHRTIITAAAGACVLVFLGCCLIPAVQDARNAARRSTVI
jgi:hypothetical protein